MSNSTTNVPLKQCAKCGEYKPETAEFFYWRKETGKFRNECIECCIDKAKVQYVNNRSRRIEQGRRWYWENHEHVLEQKRSYYKRPEVVEYNRRPEIRERHRKTVRAYRERNPQKVKAYKRQYRSIPANRERASQYSVQYMKDNPERTRQTAARRRARKLSLPHTLTDIEWQQCLTYWNNCCAYCGQPQGLWHMIAQEHFTPMSSGGGYTAGNILPACHGIGGCNNSKGSKDPKDWLIETFGKRKTKRILERIEAYFSSLNA